MELGWCVTASEIKNWTNTNKRQAEELLPKLVKKLILASCESIEKADFPSGDSITARSGYDGITIAKNCLRFVPEGKAVWEFSTRQNIKYKANNDFEKRTEEPLGFDPKKTSFIYVTSRAFDEKNQWPQKEEYVEKWKSVKALNADDIEDWLHECPAVHRWFSKILGKRTKDIWDIEESWESWQYQTEIRANVDLVLNGRKNNQSRLLDMLNEKPHKIIIKSESQRESYAFVLASILCCESLASRTLVIKNNDAWNYIIKTEAPLILIPKDFIPKENLGVAINKYGHHVIIPDKEDSILAITGSSLKLKKVKRQDRIQALKEMGLDEDKAKQIHKDTHGKLEQIKSHEALGPQLDPPEWVDEYDPVILTTALIFAEWKSTNEYDKEAISHVANMPYENFEEVLFSLSNENNPPIRFIGDTWQVISKKNFWRLTVHKLNKQLIDRLKHVVYEILGESNPAYDLDPSERWQANLKGAIPNYSIRIKEGLADTLAMLAIFGNKYSKLRIISISHIISAWLEELFNEDLSAKGWYSFGRTLPLLAEAAPEKFLNAIEKSIINEEINIKDIFNEGSKYFSGCPHANLLWAIELLSWKYLPRTSIILAELAKIDPGGSYNNRPIKSLINIYLGWINNTSYDHEKRIEIIDQHLIEKYPDITYELLLALLPKTAGQISTPIRNPKHRKWATDIDKKVKYKNYHNYIIEISSRILKLVNKDPEERILKLIDELSNIPPKFILDEVLEFLRTFDWSQLNTDIRIKFSNKLREFISRHRKYGDSDWAFPEKILQSLENIHNKTTPKDLIIQNKHFFDDRYPYIIETYFLRPLPREISNTEIMRIINWKREKVLEKILIDRGFEGVKELSNICEEPSCIGVTLAKLSNLKFCQEKENKLLNWLESSNKNLKEVASNYVYIKANSDDKWTERIFKQSDNWNAEKLTGFITVLPLNNKTMNILKYVDENIEKDYYRNLDLSQVLIDESLTKKTNIIIKKLLIYDRAKLALFAANYALEKYSTKITLDIDILIEALNNFVKQLNQNDQHMPSVIQRPAINIIQYLQNHEKISREKMALIEWKYISLFEFYQPREASIKPLHLEQEIIINPDFFTYLLNLIYKFKDKKGKELSQDKRKLIAKQSYKLLSLVNRVPGQDENDKIVFDHLKNWVNAVQKNFKNPKNLRIVDIEIGKLLSNSPKGEDDIWPHEAIRSLLENVINPNIEEGLNLGKINARGVYSKEIEEGGKLERELAEKYAEQAEQIKLKWPRTAYLLNSIAKDYEGFANYEDRQKELLDY